MTHFFPNDFSNMHMNDSTCVCGPILHENVWLHRPIEGEGDLIAQATAINDAVSVELWERAEYERLPVKIVPFSNLDPIQFPKSKNRTQKREEEKQ